jgi:hypothetical protein
VGPAKFVYKIYAGVLGLLATLVTQKVLKLAWKFATGNEAPQPADPKTPAGAAAAWALASGIGLGITQLLTRRMLAQRWTKETGQPAPDPGKVKLIL